jgi:hypothetical protein
MKLPSAEQMFETRSPDAFRAILGRSDLDQATASWWMTMVSASSSKITTAVTGLNEFEAIEWAQVADEIIDAAIRSGLLSPAYLVSRKARVQVSALEAGYPNFGDADNICANILAELMRSKESIDTVAEDVGQIALGHREDKERISFLSEMRQTIRSLSTLRPLLKEGPTAHELSSWMEAFRI